MKSLILVVFFQFSLVAQAQTVKFICASLSNHQQAILTYTLGSEFTSLTWHEAGKSVNANYRHDPMASDEAAQIFSQGGSIQLLVQPQIFRQEGGRVAIKNGYEILDRFICNLATE